jgi:hypothetical protein
MVTPENGATSESGASEKAITCSEVRTHNLLFSRLAGRDQEIASSTLAGDVDHQRVGHEEQEARPPERPLHERQLGLDVGRVLHEDEADRGAHAPDEDEQLAHEPSLHRAPRRRRGQKRAKV